MKHENKKILQNSIKKSLEATLSLWISNSWQVPESPLSNGCVEWKTLFSRKCSKTTREIGVPDDISLQQSVLAINSMSNFTGFSPYQFVFGISANISTVATNKLPVLDNVLPSVIVPNHFAAMNSSEESICQNWIIGTYQKSLQTQCSRVETNIWNWHECVISTQIKSLACTCESYGHGPYNILGEDWGPRYKSSLETFEISPRRICFRRDSGGLSNSVARSSFTSDPRGLGTSETWSTEYLSWDN